MITYLKGASLSDVKRELSRMLGEGTRNPQVRQLAELASKEQEDKVIAVFQFVKKTFPYAPDPYEIELFIHPRRIAQDYFEGRIRQGDCDDLSLLTAAMLGSIGYQTRLVLVDSNLDNEIDHALAQVYSEPLGEWLNLDVASNNPIGWVIQTRVIEYVNTS